MHFRYPPPGNSSVTYNLSPPLGFIECADITLKKVQESNDYFKEVI